MLLASTWLGYVSIILLIAMALAPREGQRAALLILSALCGTATSVILLDSLGYAFLFILLIVVVLVRIAMRAYQRMDVRFSPQEQKLRELHLGAMEPTLARRLIDEGHWITAQRGDTLIEEAQAAPCLFFLASGSATVSRNGVEVGRCTGGDLIGEATVVDGAAASGTVRLVTKASLWFVPAERLRTFLEVNPAAASALHAGFAGALRSKLASANARAAQGEP